MRDKVAKHFNRRGSMPLDHGEKDVAALTMIDFPLLRPFPFIGSTTVVLGSVTNVQTHFSSDHTGIYREIALQVEEVLKDDSHLVPANGVALIAAPGGAVKLPNGKVIWHGVRGAGEPLRGGRRYLLFLQYQVEISRFEVITAWQFDSGRVVPTSVHCSPDDRARVSSLNEDSFMREVRMAVQ